MFELNVVDVGYDRIGKLMDSYIAASNHSAQKYKDHSRSDHISIFGPVEKIEIDSEYGEEKYYIHTNDITLLFYNSDYIDYFDYLPR